LISVMPCLLASPERGRTCASYPGGIAIANPQGIKTIAPRAIDVGPATAAHTSIPAACSVIGRGNANPSPFASRFTCNITRVIQRIIGNPPPIPTAQNLRDRVRRASANVSRERASKKNIVYSAAPADNEGA